MKGWLFLIGVVIFLLLVAASPTGPPDCPNGTVKTYGWVQDNAGSWTYDWTCQ